LTFRVSRAVMAKLHREANSYGKVQSVQIYDVTNPAGFRKP
jgi:DNA topoisomerase IA